MVCTNSGGTAKTLAPYETKYLWVETKYLGSQIQISPAEGPQHIYLQTVGP